VERAGKAQANSAVFNTMMRIALFLCNQEQRAAREDKTFGWRDENHRRAGKKLRKLFGES
jgi:hypothetical protein